jgi:acetate---CoA ligase (ADP-forming)
VFEDPSRAVAAVAALIGFGRSFRQPVPESTAVPRPKSTIRSGVGEHEAKRVLADWGIPVLDERLARSADEAMAAFTELGGAVVLKVASPDVLHKTEVGGVLLDLRDADAVRQGYAALRAHGPEVLVAPYVTGGVEVIIGVKRDPVFGPVVMVGLGGILVEVLQDVVLRPAPVDRGEALAMIAELKGRAVLDRARGQPAGDVEALADALAALSRFAAAHADEVESVDINPLLVLPRGRGVVALDALIVGRTT